MQYGSAGLEKAEDPVLNGSDNRLFSKRFSIWCRVAIHVAATWSARSIR